MRGLHLTRLPFMRTLGGEREVLTPTRLLLGIGPGLRATRTLFRARGPDLGSRRTGKIQYGWRNSISKMYPILCPPYRQPRTVVHSQPHPTVSTKLLFFSSNAENGRFVLDGPPALGAGGPEFKSRRPDQNISRVFFSLMKAPFTQNSSVEFWQTGVLNSQVV